MTPTGTEGSCVNLQPLAIPQAAHLLLITSVIYIELGSITSRLGPSSHIKLCGEQLTAKEPQGAVPWSLPISLLPHQGQRWRKEAGRGTDRKLREERA